MKVYVIIYDNCGEYECYDEQVVAVMSSKEKAEEYEGKGDFFYHYPRKRIEEFILDKGE